MKVALLYVILATTLFTIKDMEKTIHQSKLRGFEDIKVTIEKGCRMFGKTGIILDKNDAECYNK
jgi:hypothetical protein